MKLAIIGAGMAGLAAARRLRQKDPTLTITIYEKSTMVGGRVATGRHDQFAFDHGAQYLKAPTAELLDLIQAELPTSELFDIARPVWVFDAQSTIAEGDPLQNADPKWSYRSGLDLLAKLMATGLDIRYEVQIQSLQAGQTCRWGLIDSAGQLAGEADAILFTPPAPQVSEILAQSSLPDPERIRFIDALLPAIYRRCLSFALAYDRLVQRPFYALVNIDRGHPISWLALEHAKGLQRCPAGHALLVAQMAPSYSQERWDTPVEQIIPELTRLIGDLLGEDLDTPLWVDRQQWQYALPDGGVQANHLHNPALGLFFAGDYTAGIGRIHLAIEQGWQVADSILSSISG